MIASLLWFDFAVSDGFRMRAGVSLWISAWTCGWTNFYDGMLVDSSVDIHS